MERKMEIKWLGHSCFKLTCDGASLVIDPYDKVQGYPELHVKANEVICSHAHGDHGYVQAVELEPLEGESPFEIKVVKTFHDDRGGALRGENLVHVIKAEGMVVVHLGDLGHLLTPEQLKEIGHADLVLAPVGGHYTIDAKTAKMVCDAIGARVVIPMHYRRGELGFDVISEVDPFLDMYPGELVRVTGENVFTLTPDTEKQVFVMTFRA